MSTALDYLVGAAERAAIAVRSARPSIVEAKAYQDFVTDVDRRIEAQVSGELSGYFSGIPIIGEEGVSEGVNLPRKAIVVDPIDGTGNWIAGLPFSAVSIALIEEGQTVLAAVADITGGTINSAELGAGSWCNGRRLRSPVSPPSLIALSTGLLDALSYSPTAYRGLRAFGKVRNFGAQSLQLCGVARGSLALCASMEARLWDDAAGRLIATEAGVFYQALVPSPELGIPSSQQRSLCAHPDIFDAVARLLSPVMKA